MKKQFASINPVITSFSMLVVAVILGPNAYAAGYTENGTCSLYEKNSDAPRIQLIETAPCTRQFGSGTGVFGINFVFETGREVSLLAQNFNGDDHMEYTLDNMPALPHAEPVNSNDECFGAAGPDGLLLMCFKGLEEGGAD